MAAEQLSLLDLCNNTSVETARPRRGRPRVVEGHASGSQPGNIPAARPDPAVPAPVGQAARVGAGDDCRPIVAAAVVHRFPEAFAFLSEHGADAVAVLDVLIAGAVMVGGRLEVSASSRAVAAQLGFCSKDSAHRRLRQLRRAGVLEMLPSSGPAAPPTYVLHLEATGISKASTS